MLSIPGGDDLAWGERLGWGIRRIEEGNLASYVNSIFQVSILEGEGVATFGTVELDTPFRCTSALARANVLNALDRTDGFYQGIGRALLALPLPEPNGSDGGDNGDYCQSR